VIADCYYALSKNRKTRFAFQKRLFLVENELPDWAQNRLAVEKGQI
jgi:hypothetical protein